MVRIGLLSFTLAVCILALSAWFDGLLGGSAIAGVLTLLFALICVGLVSKPFGLTGRRRR